MDGTEEAFRTVCRAHARHGTTALLATTTVARHDQHMSVPGGVPLAAREADGRGASSPGRTSTAPTSASGAAAATPPRPCARPRRREYRAYLEFADVIRTATVAPELPGAEAFVRACLAQGVRCNAGHSHATFDQVSAAVALGRPARRSPLLRHVGPGPAAADADLPHARRADGGDAVLRRADDGGHRRRQAPRPGTAAAGPKVKGPDRLASSPTPTAPWTCPTANTSSAARTAASRSAASTAWG